MTPRALRLTLGIGVVATMAAAACDLQPQPLPPVDRNADETPTSGDSKGGSDNPGQERPEPTAPATQNDGGDGGSGDAGDAGDAG